MRTLSIVVAVALGGCLDGAREEEAQRDLPLLFGCLREDGGACVPFPITAECGEGVHVREALVADTQPPEIVGAFVPTLPLDDRLHRIEPKDCVTVRDACSQSSDVFFTSVTSDEPVAPRQDPNGFTPVDVMSFGCQAVDLRGWADPDGNGRVYALDWRAVDAVGHTLDGTCFVHVPVLPASVALEDPPAYTIDLSRSCMPL